MKKVLIIAPSAFGYTEPIVTALAKNVSISAEIIYLDLPKFTYHNFLHRLQNTVSKIFFKRNLKKEYVAKRIKKKALERDTWDTIFMIRPDVLDDSTLDTLRKSTSNLIAYYWDSTRRFPRKVVIKDRFDIVYSYDKLDVAACNFKFLTNYMLFENEPTTNSVFQFFNISTNDYRLPILERLTEYIDSQGWSRKILVYNGSEMEVSHVELITTQKSIDEVAELIAQCKIIVEIQRTEQIGLSFRIFEALGQRKKLITTNKDIVNYDFYHPQNILVLDEDRMEIPKQFVESPYAEIDNAILDAYRIEAWVASVFQWDEE